MTTATVAPVGLYSIGVRGIDVEALLVLAADHDVPFVQLRGGPRGFDIARRSTATLASWARQARERTPITVVTADLDLVDFLQDDPRRYPRACAELDRLAEAAALLGAGAVRLMGRRVPVERQWNGLAVPNLIARHGLTTLVELHDPAWFTPAVLAQAATYLDSVTGLAVLVDSAQVHGAWLRLGDTSALTDLAVLVSRTRVVHLSDNGVGLTGAGHRIVVQTFGCADSAERRIEFAFEWTGADRSADVCMARHRRAIAWWRAQEGCHDARAR